MQEYGNYEISLAIVQDLGWIGLGTNTYLLNIICTYCAFISNTLCVCIFVNRWNRAKISIKQRKDRVKQKKVAYLKQLEAEDDE